MQVLPNYLAKIKGGARKRIVDAPQGIKNPHRSRRINFRINQDSPEVAYAA